MGQSTRKSKDDKELVTQTTSEYKKRVRAADARNVRMRFPFISPPRDYDYSDTNPYQMAACIPQETDISTTGRANVIAKTTC
ncbi:hypothetical protein JTE90_010734 [Oedothorax gibbosus]|uniref:Uncharacterized protein n=1 Tax=Oedothorax gibbosus TaxID=931172 RepID=A0AAV6UQN0_9ARAC|nr:hypothetical protein JTE90_010734 [Oedothorax gibbosus]